jgi:hypothetical protein
MGAIKETPSDVPAITVYLDKLNNCEIRDFNFNKFNNNQIKMSRQTTISFDLSENIENFDLNYYFYMIIPPQQLPENVSNIILSSPSINEENFIWGKNLVSWVGDEADILSATLTLNPNVGYEIYFKNSSLDEKKPQLTGMIRQIFISNN